MKFVVWAILAQRAWCAVVDDNYAPESVFISHPTNASDEILKLAPYVERMLPVKGQAAAYVCQDFT